LEVVAEGVERRPMEFLSHSPIGVQGYLLAYPVETQDGGKGSTCRRRRARSILEASAKDRDRWRRVRGSSLVFCMDQAAARTTN